MSSSSSNPVDFFVNRIQQAEHPVALLGIGNHASGKSTLLRLIGRELSVPTIDVDRLERAKSLSPRALAGLVLTTARQDLTVHQIALIDNTNCYLSGREETIGQLRKLGAASVGGVWVDISLEDALDRNRDRTGQHLKSETEIRHLDAALRRNPPSESEDFDFFAHVLG